MLEIHVVFDPTPTPVATSRIGSWHVELHSSRAVGHKEVLVVRYFWCSDHDVDHKREIANDFAVQLSSMIGMIGSVHLFRADERGEEQIGSFYDNTVTFSFDEFILMLRKAQEARQSGEPNSAG